MGSSGRTPILDHPLAAAGLGRMATNDTAKSACARVTMIKCDDPRDTYVEAMRLLDAIIIDRTAHAEEAMTEDKDAPQRDDNGTGDNNNIRMDTDTDADTMEDPNKELLYACCLTLSACSGLADRNVRNPKVFYGSYAKECAYKFIKLIGCHCISRRNTNNLTDEDKDKTDVDVYIIVLDCVRKIRASWLMKWSKSDSSSTGKINGDQESATQLCLSVAASIIYYYCGDNMHTNEARQEGNSLAVMLHETMRELNSENDCVHTMEAAECALGKMFLSMKSHIDVADGNEGYRTIGDDKTMQAEDDDDDDDDDDDEEQKEHNSVISSMVLLGCTLYWYVIVSDNGSRNDTIIKSSEVNGIEGTSPILQEKIRYMPLRIFRRLLLDGMTGRMYYDICSTSAPRTISPINMFLSLLHSLMPPQDRLSVIKDLYVSMLNEGSYQFYHNAIAALLLANVPRTLQLNRGRSSSKNEMSSKSSAQANMKMHDIAVDLVSRSLTGLNDTGNGVGPDLAIHCHTDRIIGGLNILRFLLLNYTANDDKLMHDIIVKFTDDLKVLRQAIDSSSNQMEDSDTDYDIGDSGNKPLGIEIMAEVLTRVEEIIACIKTTTT